MVKTQATSGSGNKLHLRSACLYIRAGRMTLLHGIQVRVVGSAGLGSASGLG